VVVLGVAAVPASAGSLYSGPGPRPGPDLLYAKPKTAPQLTNRKPFRARPILVSGATSYRKGEFLYQDFLYDDHGAREAPDPNDPKAAGNLFSKPNGTYTYPTDERYANNAADMVELRVRPLKGSTAFRLTLNTLKDRRLVAFTIAIGGKKKLRAFPHGANVKAPAALFLTVRPKGKRLVTELVRASNGKRVRGRAPRIRVDVKRRQITVRVSHKQWNPRRHKVRLAAGVGLWDAAKGAYLLPQASADATHPGGAGTASAPAAFFNVAFRSREPFPKVTEGLAAVVDAAWWRDRAQGNALAANDISSMHATVDFKALARRKTSNRGVPKRGAMDRILAARRELGQGADFSESCISTQSTCVGQYRGRLQPYAIYIPRKKKRPKAGWGLTLLLHSLSAPYNQYLGSHNQSQFGERGGGSIVITPEARGPDEFYENNGAADVFEVWADVARRYRLDPAFTVTTGYSMGGIGTFKLAEQFPDLFARIQPTVGDESATDNEASLRNVPVLMWNNHGDELVQDPAFAATAAKLDSLGYRYELHSHQPCANAGCSPLFPNHLQLAVNDQFAPSADFLGTAKVDRNPAHVTLAVDTGRDHPNLGLVADHAYWVSAVKLRGGDSGQFDARSAGFGRGDPAASTTQLGTGTLNGGSLGSILFDSRAKTWGAAPAAARSDTIEVTAKNVRSAAISVGRARVSCNVKLNISTDGPIDIAIPGCNRTVHAEPSGPLPGLPPLPSSR
jgi:pimeloyl-ACP methyl ester carboxylesterase